MSEVAEPAQQGSKVDHSHLSNKLEVFLPQDGGADSASMGSSQVYPWLAPGAVQGCVLCSPGPEVPEFPMAQCTVLCRPTPEVWVLTSVPPAHCLPIVKLLKAERRYCPRGLKSTGQKHQKASVWQSCGTRYARVRTKSQAGLYRLLHGAETVVLVLLHDHGYHLSLPDMQCDSCPVLAHSPGSIRPLWLPSGHL